LQKDAEAFEKAALQKNRLYMAVSRKANSQRFRDMIRSKGNSENLTARYRALRGRSLCPVYAEE